MFSGRPSVPLSVRPSCRPSVRDSRGSFMFPQYLQYLLTDVRQTFITGASWDTDELITFLGQKVKVQGHTIAAEAHSTRRYRRVQLFLVVFMLYTVHCHHYLCRCLASGEGIVSVCVRLSHCVCVSGTLVSVAKVMRCIQCTLVSTFTLCKVSTLLS